jgi:hypothetical protein
MPTQILALSGGFKMVVASYTFVSKVLVLRRVHAAAPRSASQLFQMELYNSLFLMGMKGL